MPTILSWIIAIITVFWMLSVVDAFMSKKEDRDVWIAVTILLYILGTLLYIFIAMEKDSFFMNYLKRQLANIKSCFKTFSLFSLTLFLDAIFYLITAFCIFIFFILIRSAASSLNTLDLDSLKQAMATAALNTTVTSKISDAVGVMRSFYITFIVYLVILILLAVLLYSVFNGICWACISKSKMTWKYFLNFFFLTLLLAIILAAIITALAFFTQEYVIDLLPYVLLVFFYFAYIAFYLFTRHQKVWISVRDMFVYGVSKVHRLAVPFAFLSILYLIIFALYYYIAKLGIQVLTITLYIVALAIFLAFLRLFLYETYKDAIKEKL